VSIKNNAVTDPSSMAGIATLNSPDLRNNQIAVLGNALSVLARQPYLMGNPVCQLLILHPPLNDACRRVPRPFIVDIVVERPLNQVIIRAGAVRRINP
jgi:hypothetical protein